MGVGEACGGSATATRREFGGGVVGGGVSGEPVEVQGEPAGLVGWGSGSVARWRSSATRRHQDAMTWTAGCPSVGPVKSRMSRRQGRGRRFWLRERRCRRWCWGDEELVQIVEDERGGGEVFAEPCLVVAANRSRRRVGRDAGGAGGTSRLRSLVPQSLVVGGWACRCAPTRECTWTLTASGRTVRGSFW